MTGFFQSTLDILTFWKRLVVIHKCSHTLLCTRFGNTCYVLLCFLLYISSFTLWECMRNFKIFIINRNSCSLQEDYCFEIYAAFVLKKQVNPFSTWGCTNSWRRALRTGYAYHISAGLAVQPQYFLTFWLIFQPGSYPKLTMPLLPNFPVLPCCWRKYECLTANLNIPIRAG